MVFLLIIIGYLIGSIPCGYIAGKIKGVDVMKEGFKKIGASNIYRTMGPLPALLVFFGDFMKGIIPILIGKAMGFPESLASIAGIAAICGHNWPVWLGFKSEGRGTATSLGALYYLMPREALILFVVIVVGLTLIVKSTPVAFLIFFFLMPFGTRLFHEPLWMAWFAIGIFGLILFTRIISGMKEIKASESKKKTLLNLILFDKISR
ncbi:glycerol-3-phosphate acyltransferase [candidate division WOR-3 bacterium]|nr:glycerol-3-phosphate acyltransferase [candidate division WOR-3 bacterium]